MDKPAARKAVLGWRRHLALAVMALGSQLQTGEPGASQGKGLVTVTCWQLVELLGEVGSSIRHTVDTARS